MSTSEDWFLVALYVIMTGVAAATEIATAKHRTAAYLWMRIRIPIAKYLLPSIAALSFTLALSTWCRGRETPFWAILIAIAVFNTIAFVLESMLADYAAIRVLNQFVRMYPNYCPVCVFVHYGLRRGWCEQGVVLPGHDEVHAKIAQESMKAAEKRVAERERV